MNINGEASKDGRSRFRAAAGIGVLIIFLGTTLVFLAFRTMAILELYQKGLRLDVVILLTIRNLSLAIVVMSSGFLLLSLIYNLSRVVRVIALTVLVLGVFSAGIGTYAEQCLWTRVRDNLRQFHRALEDYELERDSDTPLDNTDAGGQLRRSPERGITMA